MGNKLGFLGTGYLVPKLHTSLQIQTGIKHT